MHEGVGGCLLLQTLIGIGHVVGHGVRRHAHGSVQTVRFIEFELEDHVMVTYP